MRGDELMDDNALRSIENIQGYEDLIRSLVLEHKKVYEGFIRKRKDFKSTLFNDYKFIMEQIGYKIDNIESKQIARGSKHTIEFYERNEKIYLNLKSEKCTVEIKNNGKVDFNTGILEKLFVLYITSPVEGKMFDFGGWSYYDKLTCNNKDYQLTLDYFSNEYNRLKGLLGEQIRMLNEVNNSTFLINMKLFVLEGGLIAGSGYEKQIGKYSTLQQVIDKAFELDF
jgi:hypothetical protein